MLVTISVDTMQIVIEGDQERASLGDSGFQDFLARLHDFDSVATVEELSIDRSEDSGVFQCSLVCKGKSIGQKRRANTPLDAGAQVPPDPQDRAERPRPTLKGAYIPPLPSADFSGDEQKWHHEMMQQVGHLSHQWGLSRLSVVRRP